MSLLKSAWEIVLERTENIQADPEKIKKEAVLNESRRLTGTFLTTDSPDPEPIGKAYGSCDTASRIIMREGIALTILLNIALPQTTDFVVRFDRLLYLAKLIEEGDPNPLQMLGQIKQFLQKYLAARDSLADRMKQQYQGMFDEKQERMIQKYGKGINSAIEQDPEYLKLVQKGYAQISAQYQQALGDAKEQLRQMWGLAP